ncbi:MAG: hypothetical protein L0387_27500 [Acidobacteria bacterium]|nr:hypothetical protein [Acidobacteriota bacterium]
MPTANWRHIDERLRLRLADLSPQLFELFFLHFLRAGISLTVERHGGQITKRVISAETYAAGSGRNQKGIDLRVEVEGDARKEMWVFQCKRHKTWSPAQTREAIQKASQYPAQHYFLVVACDPHEGVQDEIHKLPNWTFWNLDTLCAEFRLRVHPSKHAQVLFFLSSEELKRFVPFTTEALMAPEKFFERFLGADKLFRHDWKLVGRDGELQTLRDFLASLHKVQVLSAKGGDGKSRLLWELCRTLAMEGPDNEILCLNPHRDGDDLSFGFTGNPPRRLVLVDDAHRAEQVPLQLLALVREDSSAKVILATRPQGVEALAQKLYEAGLANHLAPQLSLSALKKSDIKALASEALGETLREHAGALAELTADCAFLTVIAGELLRLGRLEWGQWASHDEFRRHVFREFEQNNLETIPEADRDFASGLMRMLALLAPAVVDARFPEKAARSLGCSVFTLETQLNRLRQSELVAGREDGLRIVPDLFADFLVYDTCYGPKKLPGFVQGIIREFEDRSAALLRNLSEATWVARANGIADDALLNTVLEPERRRFEAASFYRRAEMLRSWSSFSVFLPVESLELAKNAIALKTAPEAEPHPLFASLRQYDSHEHVCEQIPALIKPVGKHHDKHRHAALDLLWDLGLTKSWAGIGYNQNHPWAVIADVIKFEPKKWVPVTLDALAWLEARLQRPESLSALEGPAPMLRTLVGPCFERLVEFNEREGRTFRSWRQPVSIENTQRIRDHALAILQWVIDRGSWLSALDALSALEAAIRRVSRFDTEHTDDVAKFRAEWLPERLKALAVYEKAVVRHVEVAVRYEIRQTLKRDLAYEEDSAFGEECRRVLAKVSEDLPLSVAVAILSQGAFEFEDEEGVPHHSDDYEKVQALWSDKVRETARQLHASYPTGEALFGFLQHLANELVSAGYHVFAGPLFAALAQTAPALAAGLAKQIIESGSANHLAREWPVLIEKNTEIGDERRIELFRKATGSHIAGASAAVVRLMSSQALGNKAISDTEKALLLEIAAQAAPDEAFNLLQLVEWSGEANLPWAFQILQALPIRDVASEMLERVLQALVPYGERKKDPPGDLVEHVLKQLVSVPNLDFFHHSREWDVLMEKYPREIYELIRERIAYAASGNAPADYNPVPTGCFGQLALSALAKEPDYPAICDDLWERVASPNGREAYAWVCLFQAVVFENPSIWLPRMLNAVTNASSGDALLWLAQLLKFDGSLIIFRFPEITRAFLRHALALGGDQLCKRIRVELYSGCGPQTRAYSNGILDKKMDCVEAAAAKAAEAHASDELLGPFYRWMVEVEQKDRLMHKMQAHADMASLD